MSARRLLSSVAFVLAVAGCARALPPPHEPVTEEAGRALALLADQWREFADLRTRADIQIMRNGERQQLQGVLLARAPASVRFEALSPFGQPLLLVAIHDGHLTAYDASSNEAFVGPATADTTARLLHLPFEPDDLVGVLAGRAVPPRDLRVAEILPPDEQGRSLHLIGGDHRQRVWMDFVTGVVHQLEITGGRYEVRITYRREPGGRLRGFDFAAGQSYVTGSVQYRDPVFGGGVEPERFRLTIPEAAKIQRLR
ncbi:MAG: hypothetical protein HY728_08170 [Candidatus Rokubacteria bacterium]|nr:hypothetical protein [Candidatus Rokubacteria bacterium]